MFTLSKILVPLDIEDSSSVVEHTARDLARISGAELILLHVLNDVPVMLTESPSYPTATLLKEYEGRLESVLAQRTEHAHAAGVKARYLLVRGFPDQRIVEAAAAEKADLVVMGTHGRRGFQRFMLGSVAERVVRASPVPVMTVRNAPAG